MRHASSLIANQRTIIKTSTRLGVVYFDREGKPYLKKNNELAQALLQGYTREMRNYECYNEEKLPSIIIRKSIISKTSASESSCASENSIY